MKTSISTLSLAVLLSGCAGVSQSSHSDDSLLNSFDIRDYRIIDLSRVQSADMPAASVLKLPEQEFFMSIEQGDDYNIEVISYAPHTGTHVDAPYHVIQDGMTVEGFDPAVLIGRANVIDLPVSGDYLISLADIQTWEANHGDIEQGEGVLFDTQQDALWPLGNAQYIDQGYPTLSVEAARYLVTKDIGYIGVESISPDGPEPDAHRVLLENGILVVENLKDLDKIGSSKTFVIGTVPAVEGASGAWVRLLALEPAH
ncbi:cyclase family protein [Halomonas sp. HMF6819]|uniref:cyclase family protein n=1 Tax=Halomonas sp. HMF6819 TaxID=3373085 RepID=UPI00378EC4E9